MRRAALLCLMAAACGDDAPEECFVGSRDAGPEVAIVLRQVDGTVVEATPGGPAPIIKPPQGGKVVFVGARARNLDVCGLQVTSAFYELCGNKVVGGVDHRPLNLEPGDDGWAVPKNPVQIGNWANVPLCPDARATKDVEGEPYRLVLVLEDRKGRVAQAEIQVVPTCAEPELLEECKCECDGNYVLGQQCVPEPDGGPPDPTGCDAGP